MTSIGDSRFSMIDNLPYAHVTAIEQLPGVAVVTPFVWFGGYYQETTNDFPKLVVDAERFLQACPGVQMQAQVRDR